MTLADLKSLGYLSMLASTDLHRYGWQVRYWVKISTGETAISYAPRWRLDGQKQESVVVITYEEQVAFHQRHGIPIVARGEPWKADAQTCPTCSRPLRHIGILPPSRFSQLREIPVARHEYRCKPCGAAFVLNVPLIRPAHSVSM